MTEAVGEADDLLVVELDITSLASAEAAVRSAVERFGHIDVLVLAASCNLPFGLPASEQAFVAEAARSGLLGPTFLTTRMRLKLSQSPALGGGCVINTGAVATWLELSSTPEAAQAQLVESTVRAGEQWSGLGVRVNTVLQRHRSVLPRQYAPVAASSHGSRLSGDTLVRTQRMSEAVAESTLFLASSAASRITGQTLRLS